MAGGGGRKKSHLLSEERVHPKAGTGPEGYIVAVAMLLSAAARFSLVFSFEFSFEAIKAKC